MPTATLHRAFMSVLGALLLAGCAASAVGGHGSAVAGGRARASTATSGSAATSASAPASAPGSASQGPAACPVACFTDPAVVSTVLAAGSRAVVALNTYDYRHLHADEQAGLAASTGAERTRYRSAFEHVITPSAPGMQAAQTATVSSTAISSLAGTSAKALVFGQLDSSSRAARHRVDPFAVGITLQQTAGRWLVSDVTVDAGSLAQPPGNAALQNAATAADVEITNLLTFRRTSFDADYARALNGTTGQLHTDVAARKSTTRTTLVHGGFDLSASVLASGVRSVSDTAPSAVVVLADVRGSRSNSTAPTLQHLKATVVQVGGGWKLSDLQNVGVG